MITATEEAEAERILVLMPTAKDGVRTCRAVEKAGLTCAVLEDFDSLCEHISRGGGAALLTEEALSTSRLQRLLSTVQKQPPWSDFPLVVLAREDVENRRVAFRESINVTLVERPIRLRSLISVLQAALRSRRRQYEVRDLLVISEQQSTALRAADRRKDEFLALLAHELRNPLAPLQNGIEVLQLASRDPDSVVETSGIMSRQVNHMVRLIDDLLDVARISQNKIHLRCERVTVSDVVQSAIETARPMIDAAGHELFVSIPKSPIYIDADCTRIAQVIANLLTNSSKYVRNNGRIFLRVEKSIDEVVISVEDNGIGIPKESLAAIFEMFSQVDRTIERSTGGLGIGLALVRGLVEMHGGTVTAESAGINQGSTFRVRLPASHEPTQESGSMTSSPAARPSLRILVVDDNRDSAMTMAMMLRLKGDNVLTAHDGFEAISTAAEFRPEIILMDLGMPRMNGYEATRRIRQEPWGKDLRIIALSGWGQDTDRALSKDVGCDGHLVKPVLPADLEKLLLEADIRQRA